MKVILVPMCRMETKETHSTESFFSRFSIGVASFFESWILLSILYGAQVATCNGLPKLSSLATQVNPLPETPLIMVDWLTVPVLLL